MLLVVMWQDSECYSILLNQLDSSKCALCTEQDPLQKATHVIRNAQAIGTEVFIHPTDICAGNRKLNLGFVAQIFNQCPGLHVRIFAARNILLYSNCSNTY
jgi:hypothetical protein